MADAGYIELLDQAHVGAEMVALLRRVAAHVMAPEFKRHSLTTIMSQITRGAGCEQR